MIPVVDSLSGTDRWVSLAFGWRNCSDGIPGGKGNGVTASALEVREKNWVVVWGEQKAFPDKTCHFRNKQ